MAQKDLVLKVGEGYDTTAVPTVRVDVYGTVYQARKPKTTTLRLIVQVQEQLSPLGQLGEADADRAMSVFSQSWETVRKIARSLFTEEDTENLLARMDDPAEALDLEDLFEIYHVVQQHFGPDDREDFEEMGLKSNQAPAKKTPAKKTPAKKATSRRSGTRKATTRK